MARLIDEAAVPDFAKFIDAVGELVAAILDRNGRLAEWQITTIHVGNARHQIQMTDDRRRRTNSPRSMLSYPSSVRRSLPSVYPQRLELPVQRGTLHSYKFGG